MTIKTLTLAALMAVGLSATVHAGLFSTEPPAKFMAATLISPCVQGGGFHHKSTIAQIDKNFRKQPGFKSATWEEQAEGRWLYTVQSANATTKQPISIVMLMAEFSWNENVGVRIGGAAVNNEEVRGFPLCSMVDAFDRAAQENR